MKRPWCWERLKAGGEWGDRGWDGWMASPTPRRWVCVNFQSWWWTGRPGVLQSMGSQSRTQLSDWTELNWTQLYLLPPQNLYGSLSPELRPLNITAPPSVPAGLCTSLTWASLLTILLRLQPAPSKKKKKRSVPFPRFLFLHNTYSHAFVWLLTTCFGLLTVEYKLRQLRGLVFINCCMYPRYLEHLVPSKYLIKGKKTAEWMWGPELSNNVSG